MPATPPTAAKADLFEIAGGVAIENRSYFGKTSQITNEGQLDQILEAAALAKEAAKPCVVILDITQPMCVHEFESEVDAILVSMSGSTEAACRIVAGQDEPSGLLPMQMPKDMVAVETQLEDASCDMDCYVDAEGNTYDFAYGLNWSGVIDDERVKTARGRPRSPSPRRSPRLAALPPSPARPAHAPALNSFPGSAFPVGAGILGILDLGMYAIAKLILDDRRQNRRSLTFQARYQCRTIRTYTRV